MDIRRLNANDLLNFVNKQLRETDKQVKDITSEHNLPTKYISKTLRKIGYIYSRERKQYVKRGYEEDIKEEVAVDIMEEEIITEEHITQNNTESYREELSIEEIKYLKMLYKQHNITQSINKINRDNIEIITRSIRINKSVIDTFSTLCKENNIIQTDALEVALMDFINNYIK